MGDTEGFDADVDGVNNNNKLENACIDSAQALKQLKGFDVTNTDQSENESHTDEAADSHSEDEDVKCQIVVDDRTTDSLDSRQLGQSEGHDDTESTSSMVSTIPLLPQTHCYQICPHSTNLYSFTRPLLYRTVNPLISPLFRLTLLKLLSKTRTTSILKHPP